MITTKFYVGEKEFDNLEAATKYDESISKQKQVTKLIDDMSRAIAELNKANMELRKLGEEYHIATTSSGMYTMKKATDVATETSNKREEAFMDLVTKLFS